MQVIQIGPLSIDGLLFLCVFAFALSIFWATYQDKKHQLRLESTLWGILVLSLIAGRLFFIFNYWEFYRFHFLKIIDIRDGGFNWQAALFIYALATVWVFFKKRTLFKRFILATAIWGVVISVGVIAFEINQEKHNWYSMPHLVELTPVLEQPAHSTTFSGYKGQPTVINLWASWCPPCRREMPMLEMAQKKYPDVHFVFINQGESQVTVHQYLEEEGLELKNLWLDSTGRSGEAIGSKGLPSTLFLDRAGDIQSTRLGELSAASLQSHLDTIRGTK